MESFVISKTLSEVDGGWFVSTGEQFLPPGACPLHRWRRGSGDDHTGAAVPSGRAALPQGRHEAQVSGDHRDRLLEQQRGERGGREAVQATGHGGQGHVESGQGARSVITER